MSDTVVLVVTIVVLFGVPAYLLFTMVSSIRKERRRARLRSVWKNFSLSIVLAILFFLSWGAQAVAEWGAFREEQLAHGEPARIPDYLVQFGQSTLENWQSEFLQLFSFVVLAAILIHRGSAESRDGEDRIEEKLDAIQKRLDEAGISESSRARSS